MKYLLFIFLFALRGFGQTTEPLKVTNLTGDFYIYTTYNSYKGTLFPANGMYLITSKGAVIFDTPWDTTQFQPLLEKIKRLHHCNVVMCISTHSHDDRTAGLAFYRKRGIKTYTTSQTDKILKGQNKARAEFLIDRDTTFNIGQYSFETFYPGQGHTPDNIVIWFNKEKIIYGGCLIKSTEATDLGNLADANVRTWTEAIKNVQNKCANPQYVIPGHNDWRSTKSLEHTLTLIKGYEKEK